MKPEKKKLVVIVAAIAGFGALMFAAGTCSSPQESRTEASRAGHEHADADKIWTCAMHPQIRQTEPGDCPICGMELIAVASAASLATNQISLSEDARARAAIRTQAVKRLGESAGSRRLLGRIAYDESTLRTVTAWMGGRIDKLSVRTTGETVRRGQVLATLYSPEVYSAHQDVISARQQLQRLGSAATPISRRAAEAALNASRERLRLLGVPASELDSLEGNQKPSERVRIRSPFSGTVIERMATEGSYVTTGTGLYRIANLDRLWVLLDAYESDLGSVVVGQSVTLAVNGQDETIEGTVTFVDPVLDAKTRTASVRVEVQNKDGKLRPGTFVEASLARADTKDAPLVIPETAPLFTGKRSVVYVEVPGRSQPTYEARTVTLGAKIGKYYPVLGGLAAGERVVVHGAFVIDADLQIRGGRSMMTSGNDANDTNTVAVPAKARPALVSLLDHYLAVQSALASDSLGDAQTAADALAKQSKTVAEGVDGQATFSAAWKSIGVSLHQGAERVHGAGDLEGARGHFRLLSQDVATVLRVFGNPTEETLRLAYCPMALEGEGAEWVQRAETVTNPYFGSQMHACGEITHNLSTGTYLPHKEAPAATTKPAVAKQPAEHVH